jgi:adenylate cyclase
MRQMMIAPTVRMERKLTAILCADVQSYSRLMGDDEEATLRTLSAYRKIIDSLIESHRGRFVNSAGDSVLAEFSSVVEAVNCAVEIQNNLRVENSRLPFERRMEFRIGVNLGDVMVEGEQIYGDGINVAARLQSLADPAGICISGTVYEQVRDRLALGYEDRGEQTVKNITRPVHVWRVVADGTAPARQFQRKYWRGGALSLAGLAIAVGTFVLVEHVSLKPPHTHASIPPPPSPALSLPDKPSIAVLPFTNRSGDREQEYFSDGITDDLITDLSRLQHLLVIAPTSTFAYKGKAVNVQQVGRELGVLYVLEGSVRKEADRVRINAQLVDAATGAELWGQRYERPMVDIFTLQDEIVRRIITTLNLQLTLLEQGLLVRRKTENLEAYDDVLRGDEYEMVMTKAGNARARSMFEKAVELDPQYADAYEGLGGTYWLDWFNGYTKDTYAPRRAAELAHRTIAIDSSNGGAYALLGQVDLVDWQYDQAIADGERSIALDPSNAYRYWYLANTLIFSGQPAEAIDLAKKAMRLDPLHKDKYLVEFGFAYSVMGRYTEAISILKKSLAAYPNNIGGRLILVFAYTQVGQTADARAEAAEVLRLSPQFSSTDRGGPRIKDKALRERYLAAWHKAGL